MIWYIMSREADKHIRVTEETWLELNRQKRPGDSFDDVLQRLLADEHEEAVESDM
jgi:predicted CopG family antitoxin